MHGRILSPTAMVQLRQIRRHVDTGVCCLFSPEIYEIVFGREHIFLFSVHVERLCKMNSMAMNGVWVCMHVLGCPSPTKNEKYEEPDANSQLVRTLWLSAAHHERSLTSCRTQRH